MVEKEMGYDKRRRLPASSLDCIEDGRFLRRIDQKGLAGRRVARQNAEIVTATHELFDLERHVILLVAETIMTGRRNVTRRCRLAAVAETRLPVALASCLRPV